jgi:hypothetical protein
MKILNKFNKAELWKDQYLFREGVLLQKEELSPKHHHASFHQRTRNQGDSLREGSKVKSSLGSKDNIQMVSQGGLTTTKVHDVFIVFEGEFEIT